MYRVETKLARELYNVPQQGWDDFVPGPKFGSFFAHFVSSDSSTLKWKCNAFVEFTTKIV